jgi:general secretion pathway protein C
VIDSATASRHLSRVERPAQVTLALLLAVWLGWWLADSFWLLASGPMREDSGEVLPVIRVDASARRNSVSAERIRGWEVFGLPGASNVAVSVEAAPDTRLRLELLGLFQHPESAQAGAIIAEQGKEGELFRVGARVPGNATLEEILPDRVILLRAGQREALRLKEAGLAGVDSTSAPAPAVASRPQRLDRRENFPGRPPQEVQPVQQQLLNSGGDEELGAQRSMIIQQLGLSPADGEGYRIGAAAPAELLQQVGLRPGDVIVSVNGHTLGQEGSDIAALQEFRNTGAASIVVQRGAQRFTVNYPP